MTISRATSLAQLSTSTRSLLAQEKEQAARLHRQLQAAMAAASPSSADAQRLREREAEWERRLEEAQEAAATAQTELSSRCQLLAIEKVAHEQAAKAAVAKATAAEQRLQAERARGQQLAEELDAAESASNAMSEELAAARQQADAAAAAVRQLRSQLADRQARCNELEAALAGERERSSSITARAETAEVAQQGLGSHVKVAHTRLQHLQVRQGGCCGHAWLLACDQRRGRQAPWPGCIALPCANCPLRLPFLLALLPQEQLSAARREASQLQTENEEQRESYLSQQNALQVGFGQLGRLRRAGRKASGEAGMSAGCGCVTRSSAGR